MKIVFSSMVIFGSSLLFLGLALLLINNLSLWLQLVFPAGVMLISVLILVRNLQKPVD